MMMIGYDISELSHVAGQDSRFGHRREPHLLLEASATILSWKLQPYHLSKEQLNDL